MKLIGIDLYQQLLEGALRTARGEAVERWTPAPAPRHIKRLSPRPGCRTPNCG
ncbi:hypothetical protein AB5I41_12440 [Sphingomonas sp. MMS24-JH45]